MTPAARYAAAIELLDIINDGLPAERCLTTWARQNRFAGSKDRAAVRDHVYDVLRAKRSLAALGGGDDGRALVLGLLRRDGIDPDTVFGAGGYGPDALLPQEQAGGATAEGAAAADLPDWLWPIWQDDLGDDAVAVAQIQQSRAPVGLRINLRKVTLADAQARLIAEGIATEAVADVPTGLIVTENPRRVAGSACYRDGLIELQDIASQIAVQRLALGKGQTVLDYCAGGGGKALAIADAFDVRVMAHDVAPERTRDIPVRAARAGVTVPVLATAALAGNAPFDVVLCDAPCSGSGTWRRTPDAKWRITENKLLEYNTLQGEVIAGGSALVRRGGTLAYATCSVLDCENMDIVNRFLGANPTWTLVDQMVLRPTAVHDGFFLAILQHKA